MLCGAAEKRKRNEWVIYWRTVWDKVKEILYTNYCKYPAQIQWHQRGRYALIIFMQPRCSVRECGQVTCLCHFQELEGKIIANSELKNLFPPTVFIIVLELSKFLGYARDWNWIKINVKWSLKPSFRSSCRQSFMSLILSGRTIKGRMCWVSLWIKGNSRITHNDFLILGQHESVPSLAYENDLLSGNTGFSFHQELVREPLRYIGSWNSILIEIIWILVANAQNQKTFEIRDTLSKMLKLRCLSPHFTRAEWCIPKILHVCESQDFPKHVCLYYLPFTRKMFI